MSEDFAIDDGIIDVCAKSNDIVVALNICVAGIVTADVGVRDAVIEVNVCFTVESVKTDEENTKELLLAEELDANKTDDEVLPTSDIGTDHVSMGGFDEEVVTTSTVRVSVKAVSTVSGVLIREDDEQINGVSETDIDASKIDGTNVDKYSDNVEAVLFIADVATSDRCKDVLSKYVVTIGGVIREAGIIDVVITDGVSVYDNLTSDKSCSVSDLLYDDISRIDVLVISTFGNMSEVTVDVVA